MFESNFGTLRKGALDEFYGVDKSIVGGISKRVRPRKNITAYNMFLGSAGPLQGSGRQH